MSSAARKESSGIVDEHARLGSLEDASQLKEADAEIATHELEQRRREAEHTCNAMRKQPVQVDAGCSADQQGRRPTVTLTGTVTEGLKMFSEQLPQLHHQLALKLQQRRQHQQKQQPQQEPQPQHASEAGRSSLKRRLGGESDPAEPHAHADMQWQPGKHQQQLHGGQQAQLTPPAASDTQQQQRERQQHHQQHCSSIPEAVQPPVNQPSNPCAFVRQAGSCSHISRETCQALAEQLKGLPLEPMDCLVLPIGSIWGCKEYGGTLLLRDCYWDLLDLIDAAFAEWDGLNAVLIWGTPGIGKTMMGYFILILVAGGHFRNRKKVLYRRSENTYLLDFSSSTPLISEGVYDQLEAGLKSDEFVLLMDDSVPQGEMFFQPTIAFSSPKYARTQKFLKSRVAWDFVMPTWSLQEMLQAAPLLNVEYADVLRQYTFWGGVLGPVVNPETFPVSKLKECIDAAPDPVALALSSASWHPDQSVPHALVHFAVKVVNGEDAYRQYETLFASQYVVDGILAHWRQRSPAQLNKFLSTWAGCLVGAGLLDNLFEVKCHELLCAGSVFDKLRPLANVQCSKEGTYRLPTDVECIDFVMCSNNNSIDSRGTFLANGRQYLKPISRNIASFNAAYVDPSANKLDFFKMTTNPQCSVQLQELLDFRHILSFTPYCTRLIYVVLDHHGVYRSFKQQSWLNADGSEAMPHAAGSIEQWVLCVPVHCLT